jgi:hypothetical protein
MHLSKRKPKYKCNICDRTYILKTYYDRHVICCNNLFVTSHERTINSEEIDDTPSVRDLYILIQDLTIKTVSMQKKIDELTSVINNKKRRLNAIEWLNTYCKPKQSFNIWLTDLSINRHHLELIFNNGFIIGFSLVLQELLQKDTDSDIPIQALSLKKNTIYHCEDSKWQILTNTELEHMINRIKKKLLSEFKSWQDENSHLMQDDNFSKTYHQNVIKLLACNIEMVVILSKIRSKLYNHLYRIVYIEP